MRKKSRNHPVTALLLGLAVFTVAGAGAMETPKEQEAISADRQAGDAGRERSGFIPIPMVAYTPETGVMGVLSGMYLRGGGEGDDGKPGTVGVFAMYTQKRQYNVGLTSSLFAAGRMLKLNGVALFSRFPAKFYGIGPYSSWRNEEVYTPVTWTVKASALVRLAGHLYAGPAYHFSSYSVGHRELGGMLMTSGIRGSDGALVSGAGMEIEYDTRDSAFYPHRGLWVHGRALGYHRYLGSGEDLWSAELDARWYLGIFGDHVIALQCLVAASGGEVPFQEMKGIGGGMRLRGYYLTRYIDDAAMLAQVEYRFPIVWRFAGALFAGAGQVAPSLERMNAGRLKAVAGAGLRFAVARSQIINLRLDAGFTRLPPSAGRYAFYFLLREAF